MDTANVTFWLRTLLQQNSDLVEVVAKLEAGTRYFTVTTYDVELDHDDGQFFRAMEWLMFFFQATIDFNGFSMVLIPLDHHH